MQVEKQLAKFYSLHVTQQQLDEGFIISAYSASGSKFKLLLFEATADGRHELAFSASIWDPLPDVQCFACNLSEGITCGAGGVQEDQKNLFSRALLSQARQAIQSGVQLICTRSDNHLLSELTDLGAGGG